MLLPFYLLGWPTSSGPYKYKISYFLILTIWAGVCILKISQFNKKYPQYFREFIFSIPFTIYYGIVISLIIAEVMIRITGLAEWGGGQGPLQKDYRFKSYTFNSLGFRGPEIPLKKYKDEIRIIGLGDSFMFGQGVEWDKTFLEELRMLLKKKIKKRVKTINFGKPGWNTLKEVEFFEKYGVQYKPDILILLFTLNDPEFGGYFLRPLIKSSFEVKFLWRSHLYFYLVKIYNLLKYPYEDYIFSLYKDKDDTVRYCKWALKRIASICHKNNVLPILAIAPILKDLKNYPFESIHRKVRAWGKESGFIVIDFWPIFKKYSSSGKDLRVRPTDWHPNALAHRLFAEVAGDKILNYLERK